MEVCGRILGMKLGIDPCFVGGWTNFKELNNPTYEFYPAKSINGFNGTLSRSLHEFGCLRSP